jgi:hypothetical protein
MRRVRSLALGVSIACLAIAACSAWDPARPFDRESPEVNLAMSSLGDGGDATAAAKTLEEYLSTGPCAEGSIGTPDMLKRRPDGTFDLGLSLFKIGERFGRRFGDEELDGGLSEADRAARDAQIACAVRVLSAIASDESVSPALRARARYLEGNLNFLDSQYKEAVRAYDEALALAPGEGDGGDPVGRDAAWNRAIALRRIEDKKDAGSDASNDAANDSGKDGGADAGPDGGNEGGQDSGTDGSGEGGGGNDGGPDAGPDGGEDAAPPPPPPRSPDSGAPPPPRANEDERILDQLENAPTVQQEAARKLRPRVNVRGMADK